MNIYEQQLREQIPEFEASTGVYKIGGTTITIANDDMALLYVPAFNSNSHIKTYIPLDSPYSSNIAQTFKNIAFDRELFDILIKTDIRYLFNITISITNILKLSSTEVNLSIFKIHNHLTIKQVFGIYAYIREDIADPHCIPKTIQAIESLIKKTHHERLR